MIFGEVVVTLLDDRDYEEADASYGGRRRKGTKGRRGLRPRRREEGGGRRAIGASSVLGWS